MLFLNV